MFLAVLREGELAMLPSGAKCRILGALGFHVHVQRLDDGEEFDIMPRHLRPTEQDSVEPGARVTSVDVFVAELQRLRADGSHY